MGDHRPVGKPTGQDLRFIGDDVFKPSKSSQNEAMMRATSCWVLENMKHWVIFLTEIIC